MAKTAGAHQAWNVYLHGKLIDTVFSVPDCDADYVRRGLIGHDGYDSGITVRRSNKYKYAAAGNGHARATEDK